MVTYKIFLGPNNAFDEADDTGNIRIHPIGTCKSTKLSKRCDSDNVVHAIRFFHNNLANIKEEKNYISHFCDLCENGNFRVKQFKT